MAGEARTSWGMFDVAQCCKLQVAIFGLWAKFGLGLYLVGALIIF